MCTHTNTLTLNQANTRTDTHRHTLSHTYCHTHTLSHTHCHTHTDTHATTHTHTHSLTDTLLHTLPDTLPHTLTDTLSLSHTLFKSHNNVLTWKPSPHKVELHIINFISHLSCARTTDAYLQARTHRYVDRIEGQINANFF